MKIDPNRERHYDRLQSELVIKKGRELGDIDILASSVEEGCVAIAGAYVVPSSLRALCPPMAGDPNGPLNSDCYTHKIIENYGLAMIMANQ
jgi:hypothetical protein